MDPLHIMKWFEYKRHKFDPVNFKLVMTILVKNEDDIIERNIRFHAKLGVDAFVVMDNGSDDLPVDILKSLQEEYNIKIIVNNSMSFEQGEWMTRLAFIAKNEFGADWVINDDADEFWVPKNGISLRDYLTKKNGVLRFQRYNVMCIKELESIYHSEYRINFPVGFTPEDILKNIPVPINMGKVSPKVIVNPHGLIRIRGGNHSARHATLMQEQKGLDIPDILVYHYNFRGYDVFEKKAKKFEEVIKKYPKVKVGNQAKRWAQLYGKGKLEQEYENLVISENEITTLLRAGIICHDALPKKIFDSITCKFTEEHI